MLAQGIWNTAYRLNWHHYTEKWKLQKSFKMKQGKLNCWWTSQLAVEKILQWRWSRWEEWRVRRKNEYISKRYIHLVVSRMWVINDEQDFRSKQKYVAYGVSLSDCKLCLRVITSLVYKDWAWHLNPRGW